MSKMYKEFEKWWNKNYPDRITGICVAETAWQTSRKHTIEEIEEFLKGSVYIGEL